MKIYYFDEMDNIELQRRLACEQTHNEHLAFINEIMFYLNGNPMDIGKLSRAFLLVLNKVVLDNMFRHVLARNASMFMHLVSNRTFSHDLFVNPFYTAQILEELGLEYEDKTEVENFLSKRIQWYLANLYAKHHDEINQVMLRMFEWMYHSLGYLNIRYYKFELLNWSRPMLIYMESEINESNLHHRAGGQGNPQPNHAS